MSNYHTQSGGEQPRPRRSSQPTRSQESDRRLSSGAPRRRKSRGKGVTVGRVFLRLGQVLGTLLLIGLVTSAFLACYAAVYIKSVILPQCDLPLESISIRESSTVYYTDSETGEVVEMATLSGLEHRIWVDYDEIPEYLKEAVVAIEDKRFWEHHGVDWYRTAGAFVNMFLGMKDNFGGSTLTQQLVKNVTQYDDVTVKRKIQEIFTALELEKKYEKDEILEWYLNYIYLGQGCNGVEAASQRYFGKSVSELSLAECASLIGITNNPSLYDPFSPIEITRYKCSACGKYTTQAGDTCPNCEEVGTLDGGTVWTGLEYNKARQMTILGEMLDQGKISQAEYDQAAAEELHFVEEAEEEENQTGQVYNWYTEAVIDSLIADLKEMYGLSDTAAQDMVYGGGLKIYTPFDPDVQAAVDEVYEDRSNLNYTSSDGQLMQSAITVVDNETGYVVAMSGYVGEKEGNLLFNYATDALRQPGSSFKPLAVYGPAFELGYITPATVIDDSPYSVMNGAAWPKNSPSGYKGLTTILDGVTRSVNTVAVKVLADYVTPSVSYEFLTEKFHLSTDHVISYMEVNGQAKSDIDLAPLALGGLTKGVTTFEMAAAYATFPRNGVYTEPVVYLKVVQGDDEDATVLIDNTPETTYSLSESTAYYVNTVLSNAATYGTGSSAHLSNMTTAGKTGTTNSNNDRWFAGYTPYYTAVVWTGYDNPISINTNSNPAIPMWKGVMSRIHEGLENKSFSTPSDVVQVSLCMDCGLRATEGCRSDPRGSRVKTFTLMSDDVPAENCTCHQPITVCTEDPILDASGNPTGLYYMAGEFCPEESCKTVYMVNYDRQLPIQVPVSDSMYLMSYYEGLERTECSVHLTPPETEDPDVDPDDPNTDPEGPTDNPEDPSLPPDEGSGGGEETHPTDPVDPDEPDASLEPNPIHP